MLDPSRLPPDDDDGGGAQGDDDGGVGDLLVKCDGMLPDSLLPDLVLLLRLLSRDLDLLLSLLPLLLLLCLLSLDLDRVLDLLLLGGVLLPDLLLVLDLLLYFFFSTADTLLLVSGTLCSSSGELSLMTVGSGVADFSLTPLAMSSCFFLIAACFSLLHSYSPSFSHPSVSRGLS